MQWVPSKELLDRSPRAGGLSYDDQTYGSWHPELLPALVGPRGVRDPSRNTDWMDGYYPYHEMNAYLGVVGLGLAAVGAAAYRDRWAGFGAAIFLAEAVPNRIRPVLSLLVELVAVVPSVVFGLWGIAVLIPLIGHYVSPSGNGYGLLSASIVLALMITPIIATTLLDALMQVPRENRESAFGLGATHFEVVSKAMMPMVRTTLIGGIVLALGRALGETMAVAMVSGGALNILPTSIFSPVSTIASFILTQLDSAESDPTNMAVRSLAEIALVLFIITLAVNAGAKLLTSGALNVRKRQS